MTTGQDPLYGVAAIAGRTTPVTITAFLLLTFAPGCMGLNRLNVGCDGRLDAMPPGPCAVLHVTAEPARPSCHTLFIWGSVDKPNRESPFAEYLAAAAVRYAELPVIAPHEADRQLAAADLEPTLQPNAEEFDEFVRVLGCDSYLTAHVEYWGRRYVFLSGAAAIEFRVACVQPGRETPLWQAEVRCKQRGMNHREVAVLALREMFRKLGGLSNAHPGD